MSRRGSPVRPTLLRTALLAGGALWLTLVGLATLTPLHPQAAVPGGICLLCGTNGVADAIRNTLLFLPLGLLLSGLSRPGVRAAVVATGVSATMEGLQAFVPGRHSSAGDLLFNALGALSGVLLLQVLRQTAWGSWRVRHAWAATGVAVAVGSVVLGAWLAAPDGPQGRLHIRVQPVFGHLAPLPGTVTSASFGGLLLQDTVLGAGDAMVHEFLQTPETAVAFSLTRPLERGRDTGLLRAHDDPGDEVLFLGLRGDHLIYRERTRSARFLLEVPSFALELEGRLEPPAQGVARVTRGSGGVCLSVAGAATVERCGEGVTAGSSWRFFADVPRVPRPIREGISLLWVGALLFPVGLSGVGWVGRSGAVAVCWGALLLAASTSPLLAPTFVELLAVPGGIAAGMTVRGAIPRRAY